MLLRDLCPTSLSWPWHGIPEEGLECARVAGGKGKSYGRLWFGQVSPDFSGLGLVKQPHGWQGLAWP